MKYKVTKHKITNNKRRKTKSKSNEKKNTKNSIFESNDSGKKEKMMSVNVDIYKEIWDEIDGTYFKTYNLNLKVSPFLYKIRRNTKKN